MEVNNRFDLFASILVDNESTESATNDIILPKQKQEDEQPTRNFWEIPEYIEKPIPCLVPLAPKEETSELTNTRKSSRRLKKVEPTIDNSKCEEEEDKQNEVEISSPVEVHTQSTTYPIYPPQPYKFKPTNANHRNETVPKFHRKNVLPKHNAVRGNSKSCTHQI